MGILKKSLLDVFKVVKRNKLLFAALVIVQILFIVLVLFVGVKYQIKIYENVRGVMEPLQWANYNATAIEEGQPFMKGMMKEMSLMTKSYKAMVKNIFTMIFWMLGFFLLFNGFIWSMVNYMVKKGNFRKYWGRFALVSLVFLVPVSLVSYIILKSLVGVDLAVFGWGVRVMSWIFLVVGYFMLIGFCLVDWKLKDLFKKIFVVGVRQVHWVLLSLLCVLGLVLLSLLFIYVSMNSLLLMTLSGLVFVTVLVLGKLFLVLVVKELKKPI